MALIRFKKNFSPITAGEGQTLMQALRENGRPVGSSCGGEGVCTKCLIHILAGHENLSEQNEREQALRQQHHIHDDFRVSCQTFLLGDVTVDAPYW